MLDPSTVALVTGAGSGIGRASALAFARAGATVVVSDVDEDGGGATVAAIEDGGGQATFIAADVSREEDVVALVEGAVERCGRLDCAHNNAGIGGPPVFTADYPREEWDRVLAVNLTGTWLCMKYELVHMASRASGAIVNTASTFGIVGVRGMCSYNATKHGIVGITKGAALEYAEAGVRVNAICPGPIGTPALEGFFEELSPGDPAAARATFEAGAPLGRLGSPDEIAAAVVWLCSDAASYVTGLPMAVDGGWLAQ